MAAAHRSEGEHGRKEEKGRCDLGLAAAELICSGGALLVGAPDGSRQREAERWCWLAHGTAALDRGTPSFDLDRAQGGWRRGTVVLNSFRWLPCRQKFMGNKTSPRPEGSWGQVYKILQIYSMFTGFIGDFFCYFTDT